MNRTTPFRLGQLSADIPKDLWKLIQPQVLGNKVKAFEQVY